MGKVDNRSMGFLILISKILHGLKCTLKKEKWSWVNSAQMEEHEHVLLAKTYSGASMSQGKGR